MNIFCELKTALDVWLKGSPILFYRNIGVSDGLNLGIGLFPAGFDPSGELLV